MTNLELLDPTRHDDPVFDPDSPQARRVLAKAMATETPRRKAPQRVALGFAVAATAAVAVVVATSTTAPTDARAALLQAAQRTADIQSGRIVTTLDADMPSGYSGDVRNEIRFSGEDLELVTDSRERLPGGQEMLRRATIRIVGGVAYERDDATPGGEFRKIGPASIPFATGLTGAASDGALLALVKAADDLEVDGDTYRGTVTAGEVEDAMPSAPGRSKGPAWDRPVQLEVTIEDDLVRRLVIRQEGSVRTTEYHDLGRPQAIERP